MKNMKWINHGLILVSMLLVSTFVTSINILVICSSQSELMDSYPGSEDIAIPSFFEFKENHEIYAYAQEGDNMTQITVDILALDSVPHKLKLTSNWNVTWYQITTYIDEAGTERPYFFKSIANTSWSELNWRYDWGVGEIIGNYSDMVAFKAVGKVEVFHESGMAIDMTCNDGMLVYLNGEVLKPNFWFPHEGINVEHRMFLGAGLYDVEVLWFNKDGEAFSEFKMYPVGWSVQETIQLSRIIPKLDSGGEIYFKYNATWTPNLLLGQNFIFNWFLEDAEGNFDEKTTYAQIQIPIDGYFTINSVVVQNSTLVIPETFVEFCFYSKSRGDEISSVFVKLSEDNGLLSNVTIVLSEIDPDRVWYGNYTLQEDGEFNVKGSFQSVLEEEWNTMSAGIVYSSELSPVQIHFLNNGIVVISILLVGYSIFYLRKRM